jgi:hypothetical protein
VEVAALVLIIVQVVIVTFWTFFSTVQLKIANPRNVEEDKDVTTNERDPVKTELPLLSI